MPGVLITRPEPGAAETAAAVIAMGWTPILAPALSLQPRAIPTMVAQASLITSRSAAAALPPGLPVLAVGEATAAAARALGHEAVAAGGDAASLLALACARLRPVDGPLLLAVGEGYAIDLAAGLRAAGFRVLRRIAYAAQPAASLPAPAQAALTGGLVDQAMFLSPRSAQAIMALLPAAAVPRIRAIAISPRVARVLAALPWQRIVTAARPDHAAMLECLGPANVH